MIPITNKEYNLFKKYIHSHYGIYLKDEKKALVMGRLQRILVEKGFKDFTEYYNYIISDKSGEASKILINKITTNHTFFMREVEHFYFFKNQVLPYLLNVVKDKDLRIWSAGCSSGEEPYTLSMIIDEFLGKEKIWWDTKILATDISSQVLGEAIKGVYSSDEIASLPYSWKLNYFEKIDDENFVIKNKIKNEVIFRKFNLMESIFPFKRNFHVIFCRNVMIYFDFKTRKELIDKFYNALEYGGYLFIGHSESINKYETSFKYVMPSVYRKV
ncbi:MAG: protein-glutamate O-methyltransferase CheR [Epulopiscium sp.]|nr:protein-glutamate O-methyltransferase CheR [Candidatus Epulonipiscium sp.]